MPQVPIASSLTASPHDLKSLIDNAVIIDAVIIDHVNIPHPNQPTATPPTPQLERWLTERRQRGLRLEGGNHSRSFPAPHVGCQSVQYVVRFETASRKTSDSLIDFKRSEWHGCLTKMASLSLFTVRESESQFRPGLRARTRSASAQMPGRIAVRLALL